MDYLFRYAHNALLLFPYRNAETYGKMLRYKV